MMSGIIEQSAYALICISTIYTKCYLISTLPEIKNPGILLGSGILLIPDMIVLALSGAGLLLLHRYKSTYNRSILSIVGTITFVFLALLTSAINCASIAFHQVSTDLLDWVTAFEFIQDYKETGARLSGGNEGPLIFLALCHAAVFVFLMAIYSLRSRIQRYQNLDDSPIVGEKMKTKQWSKVLLAFIILSGYYLWAASVVPSNDAWSKLENSMLGDFTSGMSSYLYGAKIRLTSFSGKFQNCPTIRSAFEAATKGKDDCTGMSKNNVDFDFITRSKESDIKNIVLVFMESARHDILPFNVDSKWAKMNIEHQDTLKKHPISPFLSKLVDDSVYFSECRTVSTFTLKSMLSTLCSVLPMPRKMLVEYNTTAYCPCLPEILRENGWDTLYYTSSSSRWNRQHTSLFSNGFEHVVGYEEMKEGKYFKKEWKKFEQMGYMGYDDIPLVEPTIKWMKERRSKGKPNFVTLATNVNHDPNRTPKGFKNYQYTKNTKSMKKINAYLNSARYTDSFVENLYKALDKENFLEDTLLILVGDHGSGLGEGNRMGTGGNWRDPSVKVPLFFHSKNKAWRASNPAMIRKDFVSSIQITPTILEMLAENLPVNFDNTFEGQSLLRKSKPKSLQMTLINPGSYATLFHQNGQKAVFIQKGNQELYCDLREDPGEDKCVEPGELFEKRDSEWYQRIRSFNDIYNERIKTLWNLE